MPSTIQLLKCILFVIITILGLWLPGFFQHTLNSPAAGIDSLLTGALAKTLTAFVLLPVYYAVRKHGDGVFPPQWALSNWFFAFPVLSIGANFLGATIQLPLALPIAPELIFSLSTGIYEEILFRGVVLWSLARFFRAYSYGVIIALILSAIFFSVPHAINQEPSLVQLIFALSTGVIFAILTVKTKSVLWGIAFHAVNNLFSFIATPVASEMSDVITVVVPFVLGIMAIIVIGRSTRTSRDAAAKHSTEHGL